MCLNITKYRNIYYLFVIMKKNIYRGKNVYKEKENREK